MNGKPQRRSWQRLATMSPAEAFDRLRQGWSTRFDLFRSQSGWGFEPKLLSTPSHQGQFYFDPRGVPALCALLKARLPQQVDQILTQAERICRHRFDLLGYEDLDYGAEIDWHCDRVHDRRVQLTPWYKIPYLDFEEVGDCKVTWELNRHQHLVTLAKAYRLSGDDKLSAELLAQWDHWHHNNPYPLGINWASSLEVAFRSLSWLWVYFLLADSPALPSDFRATWLRALAINGRHIEQYLSTYFSPNTHLLGEAVALFFIGTLCPEIPAAQRWKLKGWQMVLSEAKRQVLSDGLHFERSIYYHVYALDLFLHARVLASLNGVTVPAAFDQTIEKMLTVLCILGGVAAPPRPGDDDGGRVFDGRRNRAEHMLDPLATGAALFGRADFKCVAGGLREETLWLLGATGIAKFDAIAVSSSAHPPSSRAIDGLLLLSSPESRLIFDAGARGASTAGHAHADALGIVLTAKGRELLMDPGTCEYVGAQRNRFRGTAAHNTLRVDEEDQAVPGGPFSWTSLLRVHTERRIHGQSFDLVAASHDGYSRLKGSVVHQRWIFSAHSEFYFVRDVALGAGEHHLELLWHLGAALSPQVDGTFAASDGSGLSILAAGVAGWSREVVEDCWSPVYGLKAPAHTLRFRHVSRLPTEVATLLVPCKITDRHGTLASLDSSESGQVGAYRYATAEAEHFLCFASRPGTWQVGPWSGDAEFVYSMVSRDGSRSKLICCHTTSLSFAGQTLIYCPTRMSRCEIICAGPQFEKSSSEASAIVNEVAVRAVSIEPEPATASRLSEGREP
jgi:hypothetical protein